MSARRVDAKQFRYQKLTFLFLGTLLFLYLACWWVKSVIVVPVGFHKELSIEFSLKRLVFKYIPSVSTKIL